MNTTTMLSMIALGSALALACNAAAREPQPHKVDQATALATANEKADSKQQDVTMALAKADYHDRVSLGLADVDRRIDELRAAGSTAKPDMKQRYDISVASLDAHRKALSGDLRLIDTATADGWDAIKSQADTDLTEATAVLPVIGKT